MELLSLPNIQICCLFSSLVTIFQLIDELLGVLENRNEFEMRLQDFGGELEESGFKKQTLPLLLSTAAVQAVRSVLQKTGLWSSDVRMSWTHFFKVG